MLTIETLKNDRIPPEIESAETLHSQETTKLEKIFNRKHRGYKGII